MTDLARALAHYNGWILLVLILVLLAMIAWTLALAGIVRRAERHRREIFDGATGIDLEALLIGHTRERVALRDDLIAAERRVQVLEAELRRAKRHLGVVRFDAFEGVGGEQSFALALVDDAGDGVVVSSLLGRAEARVFGKPIEGGRSDRPLSNEEERAIAAARKGA